MELAKAKVGVTYDIVWCRPKVGTKHDIVRSRPWVGIENDATWSCEVDTTHDVVRSFGKKEEYRAR